MGSSPFLPNDGIPLTHVYGDSQVITSWVNGSTELSPPEFMHWCWETKNLLVTFHDLSITHIYREHNQLADRLSKTALSLPQGFGNFKEFIENHLVTQNTFQLYWDRLCDAFYVISDYGKPERILLDCGFSSSWRSIDVVVQTDHF